VIAEISKLEQLAARVHQVGLAHELGEVVPEIGPAFGAVGRGKEMSLPAGMRAVKFMAHPRFPRDLLDHTADVG
jgi:hypothetical protein